MGVALGKYNGQLSHASLTIAQHVVIPEADDTISFRLYKSIADYVLRRTMLSSIDFDHEARTMADKVRNVMADRHLPAEARFGKRLSQQTPHVRFCVRRITAHHSGTHSG